MEQSVINWAMAGVSALLGFILRILWQAIKDLQKEDKDLSERVSEIQVLVAGQYVKQDEFNRVSDAIFAKLDRIEVKIDKKVDKGGSPE